MLYNRRTGIYKFGNNTYPRRIRRRSNLGHFFREKSASYGPGNTVCELYIYIFTVAQRPLVGQGVLIFEGSRPHSDTTRSIGLLWTRDQPDEEASTCTSHYIHIRQTYVPPARDSNPQFQQASGRKSTP